AVADVVLGIETSCDETSAAVLVGYRPGRAPELASLIILSQDVHRVFGGVVPELASRAHLAALPAVAERALGAAGVGWSAVDKVATLLGLGYPGGPVIERLAAAGDPARFTFPRPMLDDGFEFSFSGLKTAVLHAVRASDDLNRDRPHLARAFQDAVLDVLVTKLDRAVRATGRHT